MITRIVHVSDLHFPSRDPAVAQTLADCVVDRLPEIIVVTGDIANYPSWSWPVNRGHWIAARQWLADIRGRIERRTGRQVRLFVLTGNHDVLASGLVGWCWPFGCAFNHVFRCWREAQVAYDANANLTLLALDTNPRWAVVSAKGKVLDSRLKQLRRALDNHQDAARIRSSTKILLMHHHPLPVPFEGTDWLLETRRVDRLLRFLAENKIDVVMHGHKHRATWSHLRVGGTSFEPFFIETVGAGSAMKRGDHDPRGHNFNLIDIAPGGARRVRQFFKPPAADRFSEVDASPAEELVSRLILSRFRQPYSVRRLAWSVDADHEGDGRNELTYSGVEFNRPSDFYEILLPEDELEGGQAMPYHSFHTVPAEFPGELLEREFDQQKRTVVSFPQRPLEASPVGFSVGNYTLNAYSMDRREAAERGQGNPDRDCLDFLLSDAVDELCFDARFPDGFVFDAVRVEVLEPLESPDVLHQALTDRFHGAASASGRHLTVRFVKPPPNFRYRVTWALPAPPLAAITAQGSARRAQFEKVFLALATPRERGGLKPALAEEAIIETFEDLSSVLETLVCERNAFERGSVVVDASTDLSVMVCDRSGDTPQLRLVFWNQAGEHPDAFRLFRLVIGNGNAGRAYKTRTLRLFDRDQAGADPKAGAYVQVPNVVHRFMFSVPVLDPISQLPLAVLNVGTADATQAAMFRSLDATDLARLVRELQGGLAARLLAAAGLLANLRPPSQPIA